MQAKLTIGKKAKKGKAWDKKNLKKLNRMQKKKL